MILPGLPNMMMGASAPAPVVFPAVTVTRANFSGMFGYVRPGGIIAGLYGVSGGSLSATLVPGFVTDAVFDPGGTIFVAIQGDCEALLAGVTALMDNGTPLPLNQPFSHADGLTSTSADGTWSATGARTIQLV